MSNRVRKSLPANEICLFATIFNVLLSNCSFPNAWCVPCPAAAPCAPSAGIKSGPRDGQTVDGKQERPCPCRSCCCGKPAIVNPCYKQPKIPSSYAPRRCYMKPSAPVESCTTYKLSYLPVEGCENLRGVARKPPPNLVPSCEPMESCTVQKMSFLPNPVCVTQAIRPCHHDMWGQGPMQNITTQRHDFVAKPCVLRESFKPPAKFHSVEQPFENRTINKLSYLPPEKIELVKSFAPERCYERPAAKMEGSTTHKMSYLPNKIQPKEPVPWACKGQYQKPCQRIEDNTTYTLSFLDAKSDCRRRAIMPNTCTNPVTPSKRFETQTIYKNSYLPVEAPRPQPIKPLPNLVPSTALMDGDTVQKLSFLPNPVCVTQAIRPCHHDMWGQGPMQNVTTQRHDFVAKPCAVRESCKPPAKFHSVEQPFENRTVNRMSYLDPGRAEKLESFAPARCYEKPSAKMESSTTQKMSYQPVCVPAPQRPPWACKGQYQKPCQRLESTTIYRSSFLPPGEDCSQYMDPCSYGDCNPCDCVCPSECIATDPCACNFPKAECCS